MKEVIEAILDEEKRAKQRVAEAREKAGEIRRQAEEKAKMIQLKAQEEARQAAKTLLEETRAKAQKERDAQLDASENAPDQLWNNNQSQIRKTIDKMFRLIVGEN